MTWRLAQSLVVLRDQIDAMYPNRDKRTDGVISGYPGAISGHNVNAAGVVCAMDITTGDYPGGISMAQSYPLADAIRNELLVAPRGLYTYLIHHMEPPYVPSPGPYIAHGGPASLWQWIPYTGTDPHTSHIHVSVDEDIPTGGAGSGEDPYDMTDPWNLGGVSPQSGTITPITEDDLMAALDEPITTPTGTTTTLREQVAWLTDNFKAVLAAVAAVPGQTVNTRFSTAGLAKNRETSLAIEAAWAAANAQAIPAAVWNQNIGPGNAAGVLNNIDAKPAPAPAAVDIDALAVSIAAHLTTNQAHQFIVALGQALPKE